jgi:hypothetical protein
MRTALELLLLAGALFVLWRIAAKVGYRAGKQDGYDSGYEQGRLVADNWWIRADDQVEETREKIWREELSQ